MSSKRSIKYETCPLWTYSLLENKSDDCTNANNTSLKEKGLSETTLYTFRERSWVYLEALTEKLDFEG